jgi:outer membrane receptor protein involved in Fe transport
MNIGLRLDAFQSEVEAFTDPWSAYYQKGKNFDSLYYAPGQLPEMKYVFSPRLGVSHPITEDAKLFFNYGYFFQRGNVENLYTDIRNFSSGLDKMGNSNLEFRKTISYELGIEQNVFDIFTYKLSGYYKDVSDEIQTVTFSASTYSYSYLRSMNNGYRDIMGFEFELLLPYSNYLSGRISYDYRLSKGGWYGYQTYYEDPLKKNVLQSPNIDKPKPRPILRTNLKFEVPEIESSAILNSIFSDLILSTYIRWEAGEYLTYHSEAYPGIDENNIQWTPWYNVDLNVSKKISIAGYDMIVYLEVQNLLNSKFLNGSGKFWNQSLVSQEEYLELVAKKGLKAGTYDDPDVQTFLDKAMYYLLYGPTRDIYFGVKVMF